MTNRTSRLIATRKRAEDTLKRKPALASVCSKIIELFFVTPYFAKQKADGRYYVVTNWKTGRYVPISPIAVYLALKGVVSIGCYTTSKKDLDGQDLAPDKQDLCKFLAIDFDTHVEDDKIEEALEEIKPKALRAYKKLQALGFTAYLEFSGRKGYHVFVFFEEPVLCKYAHYIGKWIIHDIDRTTEVFPKQETLAHLKIGNQIKIPMCLHRYSRKRSRWINEDFEPIPQQYSFFMNVVTNPRSLVERVGNIAIEKMKPILPQITPVITSDPFADPMAVKIEKPGERNFKTFIFVNRCIQKGLNLQEARSLGEQWLARYQGVYSSDLATAIRDLENRLRSRYHETIVDGGIITTDASQVR